MVSQECDSLQYEVIPALAPFFHRDSGIAACAGVAYETHMIPRLKHEG